MEEGELSIFPTHILLATDGSPHADLAAGVAIDLARSTGSRLHVVAVGRTFPAAVYDEYAVTRREDLRREAVRGRPAHMEREDHETRPYVVRDLSWELAQFLETQDFPASA